VAGLAAATALAQAGAQVELFEASPQAGGRCRSYFDPQFESVIDNGNHVILSGNVAAQEFVATIGAKAQLSGPAEAAFPFFDVRSGQRWTFAPNAGAIPWWVFSSGRRVPETSPLDYWPYRALRRAKVGRVRDAVPVSGTVWEKLLRPILLAALNTEPEISAAALAASVVNESLGRGGAACRPCIATPNLSAAFIDPALRYLTEHDADIRFGQRVRTLRFESARVSALEGTEQLIILSEGDGVVLAVPPWIARDLLPGLIVPDEFREIANAHFKRIAPPRAAPMTGLIGSTAEWVFAFPDRISVTISAADALSDVPREDLAARIWRDVALLYGLDEPMPLWQIVRERRATFAATLEQQAKRPGPTTQWSNLALAGDWTDTGLPATIESAVRSGNKAAAILLDSRSQP
jgi:squalene-associated FAD-dependent desaturase